MSHAELIEQIDSLSVDEKLRLLEEIWGGIAASPRALAMPASHADELKRRYDEHLADPDDVVDWDEVKAGLRSGR